MTKAQQLARLKAEAQQILDHAKRVRNGILTPDEREQFDEKLAAMDRVSLGPSAGHNTIGFTTKDYLSKGSNMHTSHNAGDTAGFNTHTEFLTAVMHAGCGQSLDNRLRNLAAGADEHGGHSDPYGGFLLPAGFSPNILTRSNESDPISALTTKIPLGPSGRVEIPARVDSDHSSSVSGGLRVYRRGETDTVSSSRMEMEKVILTATSLFGLAYATEELLERSLGAFLALLEQGFGDEFKAKLMNERLRGTGAGQMEGVLNTPALITVAKETGQAATTLVYENVLKMRARCWGYNNAVWLANHDTLPQLMAMSLAVGTGGAGVWAPSAREDAPDMLLGRPLYFSEHNATLGAVGDILLGNWSQFLEGYVGDPGQVRAADSMHVRFSNHERTFKFWLENDGRCWWRAALTPAQGSTTRSPFVVCAARA